MVKAQQIYKGADFIAKLNPLDEENRKLVGQVRNDKVTADMLGSGLGKTKMELEQEKNKCACHFLIHGHLGAHYYPPYASLFLAILPVLHLVFKIFFIKIIVLSKFHPQVNKIQILIKLLLPSFILECTFFFLVSIVFLFFLNF